jgi:hypothetical protein
MGPCGYRRTQRRHEGDSSDVKVIRARLRPSEEAARQHTIYDQNKQDTAKARCPSQALRRSRRRGRDSVHEHD